MAHLEITTKKGDVKRLRLDGRVTSIGRHPENNLVLPGKQSSRNHCVIEPVEEGGYRLRDLGSRNGTKLNDAPVSIELLDHDDVIQIGSTELKFVDPFSRMSRENGKRKMGKSGTGDVPAEPTFDLLQAIDGETKSYTEELQELIAGGPPAEFGEAQISLIDARGEVVHEALEVGADEDDDEVREGIRAFRMLLMACFGARATDLHVEPKQEDAIARMRVDGYMVPACEMPTDVFKRVFGLVKILCHIDTSRKNTVQEGHFSVALPTRRVDYRVSFTPSVNGQKLVLRVLDTANAPTRLHELGMVPWMHEKIRTVTTRDGGLLVSCGPTGSGKTTTLYSALREIDVNLRNVITIEDPVEYTLEGCTQIPIDDKQGNSFGDMLRSVLRQDPDVIYLGEIRDQETAKTAMQAAMTGHLVFTTVHAKDSIGAIFRLLDLGIEPYLVANSLNLILAQRLVRLLCRYCKKSVRPTPEQVINMGKHLEGARQVFAPVGCRKCMKTGYYHRNAIFELLEMSDELRDIILNKPAIQEIRRVVNHGLFHTLRQSGFQMVIEGTTSVEEIERVAAAE